MPVYNIIETNWTIPSMWRRKLCIWLLYNSGIIKKIVSKVNRLKKLKSNKILDDIKFWFLPSCIISWLYFIQMNVLININLYSSRNFILDKVWLFICCLSNISGFLLILTSFFSINKFLQPSLWKSYRILIRSLTIS